MYAKGKYNSHGGLGEIIADCYFCTAAWVFDGQIPRRRDLHDNINRRIIVAVG